MLQSMGSQRVGHDRVAEVNWTDPRCHWAPVNSQEVSTSGPVGRTVSATMTSSTVYGKGSCSPWKGGPVVSLHDCP